MIDKFFPPKKVIVAKNDKEWITPKIKCLISERQKAHHSGRTEVRDQLAKRIKVEIKKAKHKYNELKAKTFTNTNSKEWYQHISKIINNGKRNNIVLNNVPELAQKPLKEIVEIVNSQFATICQTYPPLINNPIDDNPNEIELKLISESYTCKLLEKYSKNLLGQKIFQDKSFKNLHYSLLYHLLILLIVQ